VAGYSFIMAGYSLDMPAFGGYAHRMSEHRHLRRLERVWVENPVFFITTTTAHRRTILHSDAACKILCEEWQSARARHGWAVGRHVVMPDHVHFFAAPEPDAKPLSQFMRFWKEWTSKRLHRELEIPQPVWQPEFFDHLLRSSESYSQKWQYVFKNPVRAGLVARPEDWPWQGEVETLMM
jgi:REP element-mobilizing transposase RayT